MIICDTQAFSSPKPHFIDCSNFEMTYIYPLKSVDIKEKIKQNCQKRCLLSSTVSTDSNSGNSLNCPSSSSESDHWEYFTGVETEDDVFTEKEVVLSYDGSEIKEWNDSPRSCTFEDTMLDSPDFESQRNFSYLKQFKNEPEDYQTDSFVDDVSFNFNSQSFNDERSINLNEISCSDSFLRWLDSDQLSSPKCDDSYNSSGDEQNQNEEDSLDLQSEYSELIYSPNSSDNRDSNSSEERDQECATPLPPIQTMIPLGSKMIHSFRCENNVQSREAFNNLIRGCATSLHLDSMVSSIFTHRYSLLLVNKVFILILNTSRLNLI